MFSLENEAFIQNVKSRAFRCRIRKSGDLLNFDDSFLGDAFPFRFEFAFRLNHDGKKERKKYGFIERNHSNHISEIRFLSRDKRYEEA